MISIGIQKDSDFRSSENELYTLAHSTEFFAASMDLWLMSLLGVHSLKSLPSSVISHVFRCISFCANQLSIIGGLIVMNQFAGPNTCIIAYIFPLTFPRSWADHPIF